MAAIEGVKVTLENKIYLISVEVMLLRTDLRSMNDKLKEAEGGLKVLKTDIHTEKTD